MKLVLWLAAGTAALVMLMLTLGGVAHGANGPTIFVQNQSTSVTDAQLLDALPVFQAAITDDFAPAWGTVATLTLAANPPAGAWRIIVSDDAVGCGCLGYHTLEAGAPVSYVLAATSINYGVSWPLVFTHEAFEMLADPWLNRIALTNRFWLVEVADPVERLSYERTSPSGATVQVSDFVTQQWYRSKSRCPCDFMGYVKKPLQLLAGGYANYWMHGLGWVPVFGSRRPLLRP